MSSQSMTSLNHNDLGDGGGHLELAVAAETEEAGKCESLETVIMGLIMQFMLGSQKRKAKDFHLLYTEVYEPTG